MPKFIIDEYGNKRWWVNGQLHRLDRPAVEHANGTKHWYVSGKLHRLDGPAVEWANGDKIWWVNGELHRLDGPAVEYRSGYKEWCVNDKRLSGPLDLLEHGANWKDLVEYLTPREIAKLKLDK